MSRAPRDLALSNLKRILSTRKLVALLGASLVAALMAMAAPSGASATWNCVQQGATTKYDCTDHFNITVGGFAVIQDTRGVEGPPMAGYITKMQTDVVDNTGTPVPISRLMLHHIVFLNPLKSDKTCQDFLSWDSKTSGPGIERFYAAGEERAKMSLPDGYGLPQTANTPWGVLYMVMNHRSATDSARVQYTVTIDTAPQQPVEPYWMDASNCRADPVYNVPGTGGPNSTNLVTDDFTMPSGGRIVAGLGHVHGGAKGLTVTEPDCDHRQIANSVPTWAPPDHPFYTVRPILHEPGPLNMTAFQTVQGVPVAAGERIRLNSLYDNSRPHTRVMGIELLYVAPDPSVTAKCGPLPTDTQILGTNQPGRPGPVPFIVPLTGVDQSGNAVSIDAPPGNLERVPDNTKIQVGDRFFSKTNVEIKPGQQLTWDFPSNSQLHNVTLANGPEGIASDNLNDGRSFTARFTRPGTYRFFCALHPVQMTERVVVKKAAKKKKKKKHGRKAKKHRR
jgi:plastocyanin